jgi:transposase-like protein
MHKKIKSVSIVYTDTFQRYNVLDVSEFKQYKNSHSKLSANEKISNANTQAGRRKPDIVRSCQARRPDLLDPDIASPSERLVSN